MERRRRPDHYALQNGYDAVIQLDADGQHDPTSIPALLTALQHADVVVGSRFLDGGSYRPPLLRRVGMWLFGIASALAGRRITDATAARMLGWRPRTSFRELVKLMMDADTELAEREARLGASPGRH